MFVIVPVILNIIVPVNPVTRFQGFCISDIQYRMVPAYSLIFVKVPALKAMTFSLLLGMVPDNTSHMVNTEPVRWSIPTYLHHGALTGIGGGPDTLPGPGSHSFKVPQC